MRPRIYYTTTVSMVVILLLTTLLLAAVSFPSMVVFKGVVAEADERNDRNRDHSHDQSSNNIGLIGLGAMGTAFARCFIDRGYSVHAWNRSYKKVEDVLGDDRVNANTDTNNNNNNSLTIHSTPQGVFDASNIIFLVINSEPHLKTIFDDILNVNRDDDDDDDDDDNNHLLKSLKGKTIVNTVTHDPFVAHDLDEVLNKYKVHHVSALLFGVPDTVCGSMAKILISAPDRTISIIRNNDRNDDVDNDDDDDSNIIDNNDWDSVSKVLRHLGTVHNFSDGFNDDKHNNNEDVGGGGGGGGDVGLASMVYLSLIQSLYFGLAGYELSLLLLSKYLEKQQHHTKSSTDNATKDDFMERILIRYQELATEILSTYIPAFLPIISNTIIQQDWMNSYVPASDAIKMFETHEYVFEKLGLVQDSYHAVYLKYLRRTVEAAATAAGGEGGEEAAYNIGISAVVQHYSNDDDDADQEL